MLRTIEKVAIFSVERVWFQKSLVNVISKSPVIRYMRVEEIPEKRKENADKALTLWSDLSVDENDLLAPMRKQVRYEIRRALKENIQIEVWNTKDKNIDHVLLEFHKVYNNFCIVSGYNSIINDFNEKRINSYANYGCVIITIAKFQNGAVYHLYVHDEDKALLMYSASDFRNSNVDSNLAGRANKLLHYKDMLLFKDMGLTTYDWGNVSSFEQPNGIDNFKMSFGGQQKVLYNVYVPNGFMGKLLIAIKEKIGK